MHNRNWITLFPVSHLYYKYRCITVNTVFYGNSSYLIDKDVCYLVLCEQSYSKKLAFSFLEDLAQEFSSLYGKKVQSVNRPYSFIEFGNDQHLLYNKKKYRLL